MDLFFFVEDQPGYSTSIYLTKKISDLAEKQSKEQGYKNLSSYLQNLVENDAKTHRMRKVRDVVIISLIILTFFELTLLVVGVL